MSTLAVRSQSTLPQVNERYNRLIEKSKITGNSVLTKVTSDAKTKLLNKLTENFTQLEAKNVSGYMRKLKLYSDVPSAPDYFVKIFASISLANLDDISSIEELLCNNMYQTFAHSFLKSATGDKNSVIPLRNLLVYTTALILRQFPKLSVEKIEGQFVSNPGNDTIDTRTDEESKYLLTSQQKSTESTDKVIEFMQKSSVQFMIYMSILMFRKHGIYHISMGQQRVDENGKVLDTREQFNNVYSSTNNKQYALINLKKLDENMLRYQYFSEFATLDCLMLSCLQHGLKGSTLRNYNTNFLLSCDQLIQDGQQYNYTCGSLEVAYGLCVQFYFHFISALPDYTFKNEDGHPSRLSQFYSIRDAAANLLQTFNTKKGFSKALDTIVNTLDALFINYDRLLELYHEGHPRFVVMGASAKDVWDKIITFIATLGKANDTATIGIKGNLGSGTGNNRIGSSWTAKPLFRNAPVSPLEVAIFVEAMQSVLSIDNKDTYKQFQISMAIASDMGALDVKSLNLDMLTPYTVQPLPLIQIPRVPQQRIVQQEPVREVEFESSVENYEDI